MKELVYLIQAPPSWLKTPSLALVFLKNYLINKGHNVGIYDLNIEIFKTLNIQQNQWLSLNQDFEENLFAAIENKYPDILNNLYKRIEPARFIGLSLTKRNAPFSFELAKRITDKFKDKEIIFGGPHALLLERENKLDSKNHWVIGEGEIPLEQILHGSQDKIYRFQEIQDLDTLPFYDFEPLDINSYSNYLPLLTSRGCPYRCNFCSEKLLSKTFRHHSPKYMIDQIMLLKNKYNTNNFLFCDSLINYKRVWLQNFCQLVIKNNLSINWEAQIRVDKNFTVQLAQLMKQAGCYNLFVGLESGSDRVLRLMNKGFDTQSAIEFFKTLKRADLHFEVSLIFGYPREADYDFKETLNFIVRNKDIIPKIAQANPFIDYLNDFKDQVFPTEEALARTNKFLELIEQQNIKYTKSFIKNLTYGTTQ